MVFSSFTFIFVFLPVVLLVYYVVPNQYKNIILLVFSLLFYAWGEPVYVILMILSILLNYFWGKDIYYLKAEGKKAGFSLAVSITLNLLILGFFKYYGFLIEIINRIAGSNISYRSLSLPLGISFYTFQAVSYLIDVYRGEVKAQKNILNFALYITMFPQLIAGPIIRYVDIEKQLNERKISLAKFGGGVRCFIIGLSKKVIIANRVGAVFNEIYGDFVSGHELSAAMAWIGAVAYTLQLYFDFSGYSDMAIGLGKMFGFKFQQNFHYPYMAESITEFWRRWHISLSTWFREYVYIPLGGNRVSALRHIVNLMIVWSLTGLWHGAQWNFVIWGVYHGILLILEKYLYGKQLEKWPGIFRHIYTLFFVTIGWVFFFSNGLGESLRYLLMMFGVGSVAIMKKKVLFMLTSHWMLWVIAIAGCTNILESFVLDEGYWGKRKLVTDILYITLFVITISCLVTDSFNPFLYFRF